MKAKRSYRLLKGHHAEQDQSTGEYRKTVIQIQPEDQDKRIIIEDCSNVIIRGAGVLGWQESGHVMKGKPYAIDLRGGCSDLSVQSPIIAGAPDESTKPDWANSACNGIIVREENKNIEIVAPEIQRVHYGIDLRGTGASVKGGSVRFVSADNIAVRGADSLIESVGLSDSLEVVKYEDVHRDYIQAYSLSQGAVIGFLSGLRVHSCLIGLAERNHKWHSAAQCILLSDGVGRDISILDNTIITEHDIAVLLNPCIGAEVRGNKIFHLGGGCRPQVRVLDERYGVRSQAVTVADNPIEDLSRSGLDSSAYLSASEIRVAQELIKPSREESSAPVSAPNDTGRNTQQLLISALGMSESAADKWAGPLDLAAAEFDITTDKRFAGWLAQMAHESMNFYYTAEIWGNTRQQKKYDTRTDLGNTPEADGDGYINRGAGPLQITGGRNLAACAIALNIPREEISERLMNDPLVGARGAGWWWKTNDVNPYADACDVVAMSGKVNCGSAKASPKRINGLADRKKKYIAIRRFMNIHAESPVSNGGTMAEKVTQALRSRTVKAVITATGGVGGLVSMLPEVAEIMVSSAVSDPVGTVSKVATGSKAVAEKAEEVTRHVGFIAQLLGVTPEQYPNFLFWSLVVCLVIIAAGVVSAAYSRVDDMRTGANL